MTEDTVAKYTEYIRCKKCLVDWVVRPGDNKEKRARAMVDHVLRNHQPRYSEGPMGWMNYLEPGVNRCRDGLHSDPHRGCILR